MTSLRDSLGDACDLRDVLYVSWPELIRVHCRSCVFYLHLRTTCPLFGVDVFPPPGFVMAFTFGEILLLPGWLVHLCWLFGTVFV